MQLKKKRKSQEEPSRERENETNTFYFNISEVYMLFGMQITSLRRLGESLGFSLE